MKEFEVYISFTGKSEVKSSYPIVCGDYNTAKIRLEYDRDYSNEVILFKMSNPNGEAVMIAEVNNDEVVLVGYDENGKECSVLDKAGNYIIEVSVFKADGKITSTPAILKVEKEQVKVTDKVVVPYLPIIDDIVAEENKRQEAEKEREQFFDEVKDLFENGGTGGNVIVDKEMSDKSTNPVQNKVIKQYVDEQISKIEIPDADLTDYYTKDEIDNKGFITLNDLPEVEIPEITVDDFMSVTSTNPVQNKVITEHLAGVVQGFTDWSVQVHQELDTKIREDFEGVLNQLPNLFVSKEKGKGLSTNDFTNEYKNKVDTSVSQEYVDGLVGNIETVLDSIISAQENLIGGAE